MDFHIDPTFYATAIEMTQSAMLKKDPCHTYTMEKRTVSLQNPICSYMTKQGEPMTEVPLPINAHFRRTCRDPFYDTATPKQKPSTTLLFNFECEVGPVLVPVQTPVYNSAQTRLLDRAEQIAKECHQKPPHVTMNRLSSMLFDYMKQTGTGMTARPSNTEDKEPTTPHTPTEKPRRTKPKSKAVQTEETLLKTIKAKAVAEARAKEMEEVKSGSQMTSSSTTSSTPSAAVRKTPRPLFDSRTSFRPTHAPRGFRPQYIRPSYW